MDGPYMINLEIRDEFWNLLDSDVHATGPYQFTDFEAYPPINFNPPYWDYGLDTDGDSDFNYLVVNINLTVDVAGMYEVNADLWDFAGMTWISTQTNLTWLNLGNRTVDISFIGGDIYDSGIDGPYYVTFQVRDDTGWWFGSDDYYTNPYLFTDFDLPSAFFTPPHSDYGLDTSMPADGIFEFLVVNASVFANDPGQYLIQATMFDPMFQPFLMLQQSANLSAGPGVIPLYFSGIEINRHGMDGSFFVMMNLFEFGPTGGGPAPIDDDMHITGMYAYTDFLSLPVSKVWGYVYDAGSGLPLFNADVTLANYSYKWMMRTMTDFSGYYEVDAFDGDIIVVTDDDDLQSELTLEAVVGDTEVTRWLDPTPPGEMLSDITFADWDNAHADVVGTMPEDNQSMRFMIDIMIGNMDGYVNQSEADSFLAIFMSGNGPSQMFTSTEDHLLCDGIHYDFVPGSDSMVFDVVGPVTSLNPMTMNLAADFTSNTTIPVSSLHRVQINNTYDDDSEIGSTSGQFPAGFNLWGYDPVQNVTVSGIGTPFFDVDPLMDPNPADGIDYVWVNMTVGQGMPDTDAPDVMNVRINGQPFATYDMSNLPPVIFLNATIDDSFTGNMQIGGANFTEGPQNWALSTPMLPIDGSFDTPTEDVTGTIVAPPYGMTLYCVYGWDIIPNHNTVGACASLTIIDDLGPEIGNVLIDGAPAQTYFLSSAPPTAPLTATIDESATGTSDIGGANYTTPLVDSWPGIMMNAVDGSFDGPTEDITADVPVPTMVGTFDYFVHAWDASSNYN
ncbi:MAG: hypothetical protein KAW09_04440, partial [Thermoplasmata archaeon]|nr:hypothetical protein [Thermoplasmata archaeon]